jgi:hypothetical protein
LRLGRADAVLGDSGVLAGSDGIEPLRASTEWLASSPAGLEYARSLLGLGAALHSSGFSLEARESLAHARELASSLWGGAHAGPRHSPAESLWRTSSPNRQDRNRGPNAKRKTSRHIRSRRLLQPRDRRAADRQRQDRRGPFIPRVRRARPPEHRSAASAARRGVRERPAVARMPQTLGSCAEKSGVAPTHRPRIECRYAWWGGARKGFVDVGT